MAEIRITLPDQSVRSYAAGTTALAVAEELSRGLAKKALAAKANGIVVDLTSPLMEDAALEILTFESDEGRATLRHSSAHVLAAAVKRLFPEAQLGIGPSIADGFYYDFDVPTPFSPEDVTRIEAEMARVIQEDQEFVREEISREEAIARFEARGEVYKVELIRDLPEDAVISLYHNGEFVDLCAGPHVTSTRAVKAFKLLSVAGAYWRGDERRPMLQRIYGTSFEKKSDLDEYLVRLEEAKKRDHRRLGRELEIFSLHEEGAGFPFYHPNGVIIRNELIKYWREQHRRRGYQEIQTPIILNEELWHRSGHWDHYRENMYFTQIDEDMHAVKPMNCPGAMLVFKQKLHSYRDLPVRYCELGLVHRHELSGVLHGLTRVRAFTQDDAHLFMLPEQIEDEIEGVIDLVEEFYALFGLNYHVELSTKPEKAMGSEEVWERATGALRKPLERRGVKYKINEGDGAFYGPKIDFHLRDSLGRSWQCATIQADFQMPERFDLNYIGPDGEKHRPVMVHRVIFGSLERFLAMLIEEYAGAFPTWLAPVQVKILPIADRHHDYARQLWGQFEAAGIRSELDTRNEKIGYKIREAQLQKIPYMLIVGDKEMEEGTASLRKRSEGDVGTVAIDQFQQEVLDEINNRRSR